MSDRAAILAGAAAAAVLVLDQVEPKGRTIAERPPATDARQRAAVGALGMVCGAAGTWVPPSDPDRGWDATSPLLGYGIQLAGLAARFGVRVTISGRHYPLMDRACARAWAQQWLEAGAAYLAAVEDDQRDPDDVRSARDELATWVRAMDDSDSVTSIVPERVIVDATVDHIRWLAAAMGGQYALETQSPLPEDPTYWSLFSARGQRVAAGVATSIFGLAAGAAANAVAATVLSSWGAAAVLGYIAWRKVR